MLAAVDPTIAVLPAIITAMGLILKTVLNALKEQRQGFEAALKEQRQGFEAFLGNHMSKNTQALENLATEVKQLNRQRGRARL